MLNSPHKKLSSKAAHTAFHFSSLSVDEKFKHSFIFKLYKKKTCSPTKHFKTAVTKLGLLCPDVQRLIITIQEPVVQRLINLGVPFNPCFFFFC